MSVSHGPDAVSVPLTGARPSMDSSVCCTKLVIVRTWTDILDDQCDCHEPSSVPHPDPESPHARRSASLSCAIGQSACLIDPGFSAKTECLDLLNTLDSCGGCTSEGQGTDCTQIPGVEDVSCEYGSCKVYSCERGLKVENGSSCVLDDSYPGVKDFLAGVERVWSY